MGAADRDTKPRVGWAGLERAWWGLRLTILEVVPGVWWEDLLENRQVGQKTQVGHSVSQSKKQLFWVLLTGEGRC